MFLNKQTYVIIALLYLIVLFFKAFLHERAICLVDFKTDQARLLGWKSVRFIFKWPRN